MKTKKVLLFLLVLLVAGFTSCQNPVNDSSGLESSLNKSRGTRVAWQPGLYLNAGDIIEYNNGEYKVLLSHTAHVGWLPGGVGTHAIFEKVATVDPKEWEPNIYVNSGEVIKYQEKYYKVLISHTCHAGWVPGAPGLSTVFQETDEIPVTGTRFYLRDMLTASPNKIENDVLKYLPPGYDKYTTIFLKDLNIDIKAGEKVVLNIKFENLSNNYGSPTFCPYINTDNNYYKGFFRKINFINNVAHYSVEVDNIYKDGVINRLGFRFYEIVCDDIKITNMSYEVKKSSMPVASCTTPFPNRTTDHIFHLAPAYKVSTNERLVQGSIENDLQRLFEEWRSYYLLEADFGNAEGKKGKYFRYQGGVEGMPTNMTPITTSESHGYGMLLLAHMDNGKNNTRDDFDAMVDYYLQWMSKNERLEPIMDWQQAVATKTTSFHEIGYPAPDYKPAKGKLITIEAGHLYTTPTMWAENEDDRCHGGKGGAADGDLDIAYSLLLADKQWGSNGRHNYKALALDLIETMKKIYIAKENNSAHLMLATYLQEWENDLETDDKMYWGTRSSDFLYTHYNAFGELTQDEAWRDLMGTTRKLLAMQAKSETGLYSDFYYTNDKGATWFAPDDEILETKYDGGYFWNACRTPWRVTTSVFSNYNVGNYGILPSIEKFNQFVAAKGGPKELYTGYTKDGTEIKGYKDAAGKWIVGPASQEENLAFAAPAFLSSIYRGGLTEKQILENYLYIMDDANLTPNTPEKPYFSYYDITIRMMTLLVYSGNWIQL